MKIFQTILFLLPLFLAGCASDSGTSRPAPEAPQILNLKVEPQTICVSTAADVSFELIDPNNDPIGWTAGLSTKIHGTLERTEGTDASGTQMQIRFKAATSGRHRHTVTVTVSATDSSGLQAAPAKFDIFVFNCF